MSVEQLESAIRALSPDQRAKFAGWFDDHRHQLVQQGDVDAAQQQEVLARLAESNARPDAVEPFEEADLDRMIVEATHARSHKAPARRG